MSINYIDVEANITLDGTYDISDGSYYFEVEIVPVDLRVREANINFQHLDDNYDRTLTLNKYLNSKLEMLHPEVMARAGYFASEIIKTTVNKIYGNFPISTLLPHA